MKPYLRYTLLGAALLSQVLDGVLTYIGLGMGFKEGNPLIVSLIEFIGVVPALLLSKAIGIGWTIFAYCIKQYEALVLISILMYALAVLPWVISIYFIGHP